MTMQSFKKIGQKILVRDRDRSADGWLYGHFVCGGVWKLSLFGCCSIQYYIFLKNAFLAHLSRRLTRWAYSIPMVRRPSVVVRRRPHFQTWISLKPVGQSWSNFMCSITGLGEGCIRFWGRLEQNCGFHGNRNPPLTYNGENDVSTFSRLFLIRSFLYLQVTRTCIKSRASSNFGQIGSLTTE